MRHGRALRSHLVIVHFLAFGKTENRGRLGEGTVYSVIEESKELARMLSNHGCFVDDRGTK
jgi:hypothetical protein